MLNSWDAETADSCGLTSRAQSGRRFEPPGPPVPILTGRNRDARVPDARLVSHQGPIRPENTSTSSPYLRIPTCIISSAQSAPRIDTRDDANEVPKVRLVKVNPKTTSGSLPTKGQRRDSTARSRHASPLDVRAREA
jgi:hypothetical protein